MMGRCPSKVYQINEQFMSVMEDSPVKCHIYEQLVSMMGRCPIKCVR